LAYHRTNGHAYVERSLFDVCISVTHVSWLNGTSQDVYEITVVGKIAQNYASGKLRLNHHE